MFKHIFIADDSSFKQEAIQHTLHVLFPKAEFHLCSCLSTFIRTIHLDYALHVNSRPYHCLVVLDMCMPIRMNSPVFGTCGLTALRYMQAHDDKCPAVIVSSDCVDDSTGKSAYNNYLGSILYQSGVDQVEEYRKLLEDYIK